MTTIPFTSATRATLKRFFGTSGIVFVNTNGDVSDLVTTVSHNTGKPYGTWFVVHDRTPELVTADELTVTEEGASVRVGDSRIGIVDRRGQPFEDTPLAMDPQAPSVTIRADTGHNRAAMKALKAVASRPGSVDAQQYAIDGLHVIGRLSGSDNPATASGAQSVAGVATNRYQATVATFAAECADVEAIVSGQVFAAAAARSDWVLTVTREVTEVTFEKLGVTITSATNTDREYPRVLPLFGDDHSEGASLTARPKDFLAALDALPSKANAVLTCDGTVYAKDVEEVPIAGVRAESGDAPAPVAVDPKYLRWCLAPLGASWPEVTLRWSGKGRQMTVDCGQGVVGTVMPLASRMVPPRPVVDVGV